METQSELPGTDRGARGRKSSDGTPEVVKYESIKKSCSEMLVAFKKFQHAKEAYDKCCAIVAERSNSNVTTLKKLVKSSAKGNFKDVKAKIDQEADIFEMVGEVSGGPGGGE